MDRKTFAIVMTLVVAGPGSAWAQDTAAIRRALDRVQPGETISVLDTSGRVDTGRFAGATDTTVTLDGSRNLHADRIARITVKDPTRNGTLIGALIGGGAGLAGAAAISAICSNEGSSCAAANLMLIGIGAGAGAGIGWLGDSLKQQEIYRAGSTVRRLSPEVRVRVAGIDRSGGVPQVGVAWSVTTGSGLGVEVNADTTQVGAQGNGPGYSVDGRALYAFGRSRIQPFVSGGAAFVQQDRTITDDGFINQDIKEIAPVFGGGVRLQVARHLVVRPEMCWFVETRQSAAHRAAVPRLGVSLGAAW